MLEKDPEDSFLNYALALEHLAIDEIQQAIKIIEGVIKRDENYLGAYYQLGKLYEQTQQINAAIIIYKKGISLAQQHNKLKTLSELKEALIQLQDK